MHHQMLMQILILKDLIVEAIQYQILILKAFIVEAIQYYTCIAYGTFLHINLNENIST